MSECRRYLISGLVQGVFFRDSTRREAERLNLAGHAVNLSDGRVEVVACGRRQDLERLKSWLREGPPMARVERLDEQEIEHSPPDGFRTG